MVTAVLGAIDAELSLTGSASNGDVMQALAMALAVRARMLYAPRPVRDRLATSLLETAMVAVDGAGRQSPDAGHA